METIFSLAKETSFGETVGFSILSSGKELFICDSKPSESVFMKATSVDASEYEILSEAIGMKPESFKLHSGDKIVVDCKTQFQPYLSLFFKSEDPVVNVSIDTTDELLEIADDHGLPRDRQLIVNEVFWFPSKSGFVVPIDFLLEEQEEVFSIGWTETASMTSGLESLTLIQTSEDTWLVKRAEADDSWDVRAFRNSSKEQAVVEVIKESLGAWWEFVEHESSVINVLLDFLALDSDSESYWGLNQHMRESLETKNDCDTECYGASPTSYWTFRLNLESEYKSNLLKLLVGRYS